MLNSTQAEGLAVQTGNIPAPAAPNAPTPTSYTPAAPTTPPATGTTGVDDTTTAQSATATVDQRDPEE